MSSHHIIVQLNTQSLFPNSWSHSLYPRFCGFTPPQNGLQADSPASASTSTTRPQREGLQISRPATKKKAADRLPSYQEHTCMPGLQAFRPSPVWNATAKGSLAALKHWLTYSDHFLTPDSREHPSRSFIACWKPVYSKHFKHANS